MPKKGPEAKPESLEQNKDKSKETEPTVKNRVWVVEDSKAIVSSLEMVTDGMDEEGYDVSYFISGDKAKEEFEKATKEGRTPQLMIVDGELSRADEISRGADLIREIRDICQEEGMDEPQYCPFSSGYNDELIDAGADPKLYEMMGGKPPDIIKFKEVIKSVGDEE